MKQNEGAALGAIWLDASLIAHEFIQPEYWHSNLSAMVTQYIPGAETFVHEAEGEVDGFISIVNSDSIAAIFVAPTRQGHGIGGALIAFAKEKFTSLSLTVYSKNTKSRAFYESHGFVTSAEQTDEATGEQEIVMTWAERGANPPTD